MSGLEMISTPTPQLKIMIEHYQKVLSPEEYQIFINDIKSTYIKFFSEIAAFPAGPERAILGHQLLTPLIEQGIAQVKPTCGRGCGTCCNYEVEITIDEGALLAALVSDGLMIDLKRLAIQASRKTKSEEWLQSSKNPDNRCVFLGDDQACQVYEFRPSICRKHVVNSNPQECGKTNGQITPILIPFAEIAMSAILGQPDNAKASLSKALSLALNNRPKQTFELEIESDLHQPNRAISPSV